MSGPWSLLLSFSDMDSVVQKVLEVSQLTVSVHMSPFDCHAWWPDGVHAVRAVCLSYKRKTPSSWGCPVQVPALCVKPGANDEPAVLRGLCLRFSFLRRMYKVWL